MGAFEICLIVFCSAAVAAIVGFGAYKRFTGKSSGCGCGCEGCPHACARRPQKKNK